MDSFRELVDGGQKYGIVNVAEVTYIRPAGGKCAIGFKNGTEQTIDISYGNAVARLLSKLPEYDNAYTQ